MSDTDDQVDDSEDDDAKEDAMIWEDLQSDSDGGGSDDLDRNSSSTPPTPATSLPAAATSMAPCVARASPPPSEPIAAPTPPSSLVRSKSRSPLSSERPDAVVAIGSSSNASETSFGPPHKPPHIPRARTSGQAPGEVLPRTKRMEVNHSRSEPCRLRSDAGKDSAIATDGEDMVVDVDSIGIDISIGLGNDDRKMVD
ncbi:hypothetical protein BGW80DRAFT_1463702 [Lactifluus volemus]|nr:hypothetical protein BGW80DRAFT_1463702 [Lactifluus volemus]